MEDVISDLHFTQCSFAGNLDDIMNAMFMSCNEQGLHDYGDLVGSICNWGFTAVNFYKYFFNETARILAQRFLMYNVRIFSHIFFIYTALV